MRICLVHPFVWPEVRRGGERYLADLARYLRSRHHEVHVLTGGERTRSEAGLARLRHLRLPGGRWHHLGTVETFGLRAYPALLRRRYDVVHALVPSAALAARLAGHRTLLTALGHPDARPAEPLRAALVRAAVRASHEVACLSPQSATALYRTWGRKGIVLPPGIWTDAFPPDLRPRRGPPRILFSAALDRREKGLDVLLQAFASVLEAQPEATLELSGPGDPSWALAAAAQELRERVEVSGTGREADVPLRYARATVTVLPSVQEAFGLVLVESLACGTPVVGTDWGGMPSIVDDGRVGRIVPARSAPDLARAILETIELAANEKTPSRCHEHARRWDWETAVGPRHEAVYADLAGRRARTIPNT